MKISVIAVAAGLFAAGVLAGRTIWISENAPDRGLSEKEPEKPARIADRGEDASLKALRARVRELEKLLAERDRSVQEAREPAKEPPRERAQGGMAERMARLERENPQRHAEITNRIARWRQERSRRARQKLDFLSSIDVSRMDEGARKTHSRLQELTLEREELEEKLHSKDVTDEERREIFGSMRECDRELAALNAEERENLLAETAKNLGFSGEDAAEITAVIKEIVDSTDSAHHFRFPQRRDRRRR